MKTKIFFLPTATRPDDFPPLPQGFGRFWHTGVIHQGKVYECFGHGKHSVTDWNATKRRELKSSKAVFETVAIDERRLKSEITSGTSCGEYVARSIGMSQHAGPAKIHAPEEVYRWILKQAKGKPVTVNDKMQRRYRYLLTEPTGKNFDPEFKPQLTPKQMLELGVFGGKYMTDCRQEFPKDWFAKAKLCRERHDPKLNFFKINASQPLQVWRAKRWIHPDDPRGWFQWYCRYYMGRRHADDARQIKRWKAMRRHLGQIVKHCRAGDADCHRKQRQALLHWAYDSRRV